MRCSSPCCSANWSTSWTNRLRSAATAAARLSDLTDLTDLARIPGDTGPRARDVVEGELTGDVHVVYLDAEGRVRRTPRPAATGAPRLPKLDRAAVEARDERPFEATAVGGARELAGDRRAGRPGRTPAGGSIVVAGSLDQVGATIRGLGVRMLVIDSLVLALLGVIGWFAVRAGLRPLRRIETTAAAIAGGDLSRRVSRPTYPPHRTGPPVRRSQRHAGPDRGGRRRTRRHQRAHADLPRGRRPRTAHARCPASKASPSCTRTGGMPVRAPSVDGRGVSRIEGGKRPGLVRRSSRDAASWLGAPSTKEARREPATAGARAGTAAGRGRGQ
ncbi:hypothetical protein STENM223S_02537 [Streptomyces tendae]